MMKNLLLVMLLMFAMTSCSETKNTTATANTKTTEPASEDLTAQGFVAGVIHESADDSGCPYTIETKKVSYLLDPTNLGNEFMKDELHVWFKFHPLRMQSRCTEATPVEVHEMRERK